MVVVVVGVFVESVVVGFLFSYILVVLCGRFVCRLGVVVFDILVVSVN